MSRIQTSGFPFINPLGSNPFNQRVSPSPTNPYEDIHGRPLPFDGDEAIAKIREQMESMIKFAKSEDKTTEEINLDPIDQTDLLYARLYDALRLHVKDTSLTDYFCFNTAFVKKLCNTADYNKGHYTKYGAYVHLDTTASVIITTPKLQFRVSEYDLEITGVNVNDPITEDIVYEGLIPILKFIKLLAEPEIVTKSSSKKPTTKKSKK